tara:strand:- start:1416 stop:2057 length:642 start_codon:yes stop_codon:yes gene_type:complete
MYYENDIAKQMIDDSNTIVSSFSELIDFDYLKSIVENPNEIKIPNNTQQEFTKILIETLRNVVPNIDEKIIKYLEDQDPAKLNEIINLYIQYSSDIAIALFDIAEDSSKFITEKTKILDTKFHKLANFIKEHQNYPINIIIDTFIIIMIIVYFIFYILYHKLITIIIITLVVLIILLTIYMENNSFSIIIIILGLYIGVFGIFGYKLYQQINK